MSPCLCFRRAISSRLVWNVDRPCTNAICLNIVQAIQNIVPKMCSKSTEPNAKTTRCVFRTVRFKKTKLLLVENISYF